MDRITFIGMPEIDQAQREYLNVLGAAFAVDGLELVIKPRGGANEAVIAGYKARGGSPTETPTPFSAPTQGVLVFGDSSFTDALDQHAPGWREHDPTLVQPQELHDYVIAALAGLKEKELALQHIEVTA